MKARLAPIMLLLFSAVALAQWPQSEFVIGAMHDPELTGNPTTDEASYAKVRDAHFNLTTGNYTRGIGGWGWGTFDQLSAGGIDVSNSYKLARVAAVGGGLKMMVQDWDVASQIKTVQNAVLQYNSLPASSRAVLAGYNWVSEPSIATMLPQPAPSTFPGHLKFLHDYNTEDPSRIAFFDLGAGWRAGSTRAGWEAYVRTALAEPMVRILAFDWYAFDTDPSNIGGFSRLFMDGVDDINYFWHTGLMAGIVRDARASGRQINYWGFGCTTEHSSGIWYHPLSSPAQLRYEAFAQIAHGAKGIIWFGYELPDLMASSPPATLENRAEYFNSPNRNVAGYPNNVHYSNLQNLNLVLKNLGPTLMQMEWMVTVHGTAIDPVSLEPNLPTLTSIGTGQNLLQESQSIPGNFEVGIFSAPSSLERYVLVHNKSVTGTESITLAIKDIRWLTRHLKTSSDWVVQSATRGSGTTTLTLSVAPGDAELIRISRVNPSVPAIISLLN